MSYVGFIRREPRFLAFGYLILFFASFGMTFYITQYNADIRTAFGLSHGTFGLLYAAATVCASFLVMGFGRLIDDVDLRLFTVLTCAGLVAGCLLLALSEGVVVLLFLAFCMLRFFGQGFMLHAGATAMARYFDQNRGKAVAIGSFGLVTGHAVMPRVGHWLNESFGWQMAWAMSAGVLGLVLIPLMLWLLAGHGRRHADYLARNGVGSGVHDALPSGLWTRTVLLRDLRFWFVMPAFLAMPFVLTAMIFHQHHLAMSKGWSTALIPNAFTFFAVTNFLATAMSGPLIDRFGTRWLLPMVTVPLIVALACLITGNEPVRAWIYMRLAGLTGGFAPATASAFWAEAYGPQRVGAARSFNSALFMIATALGPFFTGWMIDRGAAIEAIATGMVIYMVAGVILVGTMSARFWRADP